MPEKIILASSSIARRALLQRLFADFSCESPDVDETRKDNEAAPALVRRLAIEKAARVAGRHDAGLIIGSDQVAALGGALLGKPADLEEARRQLSAMSGRAVDFLTGLCLLNAQSGRCQADVITCRVRFRPLTPAEIDNYLSREAPLQCAAAFKAEQLGIALIEGMDCSDPTALIGLPLIRLGEMLRGEGLAVP